MRNFSAAEQPVGLGCPCSIGKTVTVWNPSAILVPVLGHPQQSGAVYLGSGGRFVDKSCLIMKGKQDKATRQRRPFKAFRTNRPPPGIGASAPEGLKKLRETCPL